MDTIVTGLGYGAAYTALGLGLLALGYWVLDLLTPGHLGRLLHGTTDGTETPEQVDGSGGAGLLATTWLLGQGVVIFTAIWTNGASSFGYALTATALFGLMGVLLLAVTFKVLDALTPGRLGEVVCVPGSPRPLAYLAAGSVLAMSGIISASIA